MRHRVATFKINRSAAHVRSLLANAVCSLIEHSRIETTLVRAKRIRQLAEQMVTLAKKGTLHDVRNAVSKLHRKDIVHKLFAEIGPSFMKRQGGYTRIMKLGPRIGDGAEMCILAFVEADSKEEKAASEKPEAAAAAEAPVADAPAPAEK
jgi:large subunit ribosomal protein L17